MARTTARPLTKLSEASYSNRVSLPQVCLGYSPDVVADLSGGDEQVEWPPLTVADGVQLRVHAALSLTDQTSTPPFFKPMLVADRCALRYVTSIISAKMPLSLQRFQRL